MVAEIIAVGSEMLTPFRQDTNSLHITAGLNALGVVVAFKTIVGDQREHLTGAVQAALARTDLVVVSGGLGPTEDDLTRECVAEALGIEVHKDPHTMAALYKRFAERRMTMPPNNEKQAEVLDGAFLLPNPNGSAPGQWLDTSFAGHRKIVVLLPGPPRELKPMFDGQCVPRLRAALPPRHMAKRLLRLALIPESQVDARTAPIYKSYADVATTILAGGGEIQLHFECVKPSTEEAQRRVNEVCERVEREMGDDVFSAHGETLEEIVLLMLGLRNLTLATAESCTGGLLAQRLTAVPNSSRGFAGGVVAYANDVKKTMLNVPAETLEEHGAVSEAVARAMAESVRLAMGTSLGISVTGVAGPGPGLGADDKKPVGLVYVGLADGQDTQVRQLQLTGERNRIRLWASQHALEMVRRSLL